MDRKIEKAIKITDDILASFSGKPDGYRGGPIILREEAETIRSALTLAAAQVEEKWPCSGNKSICQCDECLCKEPAPTGEDMPAEKCLHCGTSEIYHRVGDNACPLNKLAEVDYSFSDKTVFTIVRAQDAGIPGTIKLWLWKNDDHFYAFDDLYPRHANGDPRVIGEPVGYAFYNPARHASQPGGDVVVGFDMAAPEGDMSCLMIGERKPDGSLEVQHCVYGVEAEALHRALNSVPALQSALQPRHDAELWNDFDLACMGADDNGNLTFVLSRSEYARIKAALKGGA